VSVAYKRAFFRWLLFGMLGMLFEVCLMAWHVGKGGNLSLRGASSPWMLPIYGLIGVLLEPVSAPMIRRRVPLICRAAVYMLLIFAVEYVCGMMFLSIGINKRGVGSMHTVWDYGWTRYNLHGQIAIEMAPTWYLLGLTLEFLYKRVDTCATALTLKLRADTLLTDYGGGAPPPRGADALAQGGPR